MLPWSVVLLPLWNPQGKCHPRRGHYPEQPLTICWVFILFLAARAHQMLNHISPAGQLEKVEYVAFYHVGGMTMKKFLLKIKNDKALNIFVIHYLVLILKK